VEASGVKPVEVTVEVDLALSEAAKLDTEKLVSDAVEAAHKAAENYLRNLT
jgi:hypothetical protein